MSAVSLLGLCCARFSQYVAYADGIIRGHEIQTFSILSVLAGESSLLLVYFVPGLVVCKIVLTL